ncbi:rCG43973 [Rattus norvegicus]|uniref:RCG43973 n=1 Tax=Rattus norvegicus TaxID=10116 RepID=A6J6Z2_RAT|nr:rCG43973 [Rattus norvegicus]
MESWCSPCQKFVSSPMCLKSSSRREVTLGVD